MKPVTLLSNQVSEHITPVIKDYFVTIYEHPESYLDPESKDSSSNQLIKFQLALKKIPNWTNTQIKKQIDEITTRCPSFKKLLVGLFMAYIKMIADGIRTSSRSTKLDVKLPSDEFFVHTCFITAAHDIYEDPYVMKKSERERNEELEKRVQKCVLKSIHKLIPITDIINNYIPSVGGEDVSFGGEDPIPPPTTSDPDLIPEPETIPSEELKKEEEEPKTIHVPQQQEKKVQPEGDEDDLFPDAPDKISPTQ